MVDIVTFAHSLVIVRTETTIRYAATDLTWNHPKMNIRYDKCHIVLRVLRMTALKHP